MASPVKAWRERLSRAVRRPTKANNLTAILRVIASHNEPQWPNLSEYVAQADEYMRSAWVYVAVTRIAEAAALVPYNVYAMEGEGRVAQIDHPIERLLRNPNPFSSGFELIEATFGYLELTGNAYWYLAGGPDGIPVEIWPLRPDRMRIVPDKARLVGGYVYTVDAVEIPLQAEEVIHFKRWSPKDDLYGLSALEAAAVASQTDRAMAQWNRNFFGKEKAVPAGIVNIKNLVSDADYERITREFRETYGGTERRTAFIRGADIEWSDIGISHQEMDFLQARQFSKEEIFQVFGIPAGLYARNATEANALVARQTFVEDTLWPKLVRFGQKLTQQLAPFYGPNLIILPEEIRDTAAHIAEIQAAANYLTINEVRQKYFYVESVAWGDQPAGNLTPALQGSASPLQGGEGK